MDSSRIKVISKYGLLVFKILCLAFGCICIVSGLIPLIFFKHFNVGNAALLIYGPCVFAVVLIKPFGKPAVRKIMKICIYTVSSILAVCFITGCIVSIYMIKYAFFNKPSDTDIQAGGTVIVLGCRIRGDEPSTTLKCRLDAAYDFLIENESVPVIVSGGQGSDERYTEAYVMKKYLVERGIAENRIIMEDSSRNTDENIKLSGELIEEYSLPRKVYIVTDAFHSCRGFLFAKKHGYEAKNISAEVYWPLLGEYWVRDMLGVLHMTLTPNWSINL